MYLEITDGPVLTTEHSASSYGLPVAVWQGKAYGPADDIGGGKTMADLVLAWAEQPDRSIAETETAINFLRQWPDGPQL